MTTEKKEYDTLDKAEDSRLGLLQKIEEGVKNKFHWSWLDLEVAGQMMGVYMRKLKQPGMACCVLCRDEIKYAKQGRKSLENHCISKKHARNISKSLGEAATPIKTGLGEHNIHSNNVWNGNQSISHGSPKVKARSAPSSHGSPAKSARKSSSDSDGTPKKFTTRNIDRLKALEKHHDANTPPIVTCDGNSVALLQQAPPMVSAIVPQVPQVPQALRQVAMVFPTQSSKVPRVAEMAVNNKVQQVQMGSSQESPTKNGRKCLENHLINKRLKQERSIHIKAEYDPSRTALDNCQTMMDQNVAPTTISMYGNPNIGHQVVQQVPGTVEAQPYQDPSAPIFNQYIDEVLMEMQGLQQAEDIFACPDFGVKEPDYTIKEVNFEDL